MNILRAMFAVQTKTKKDEKATIHIHTCSNNYDASNGK